MGLHHGGPSKSPTSESHIVNASDGESDQVAPALQMLEQKTVEQCGDGTCRRLGLGSPALMGSGLYRRISTHRRHLHRRGESLLCTNF
ncbi:hypothetical protein PC120_g6964 [Phytophthora cactorum]|nr:hypothetical protein PC120_g6964 [Phytophthora cactorum]